MEATNSIRLTATEMGLLWSSYINDTMSKCVLDYFLSKVEDTEIRPVIELAHTISEKHAQQLRSLFISENFPIPNGFTEEDVNTNAPRLFSDLFFAYYIKNMTKVGLETYAMAFSMATRADVREFFLNCLREIAKLDQDITEVMLTKGFYIRAPYIPGFDHVDFVKKQSFLSGGFFGFGDKRPLLSIEIAHLFANIQTNDLGKALLTGYSQVVRSNEIREYLLVGKEISSKHIKIFSDLLNNEDIPTPMSWDTGVMDSSEAPFSDKLILCQVSLLVAAGTANYGVATAASPRADIAGSYVRLAAEIATFAADGAKLMIKNGWLEEPPQAPDRKELTKV